MVAVLTLCRPQLPEAHEYSSCDVQKILFRPNVPLYLSLMIFLLLSTMVPEVVGGVRGGLYNEYTNLDIQESLLPC